MFLELLHLFWERSSPMGKDLQERGAMERQHYCDNHVHNLNITGLTLL